jgi:uncharacterized membrane protein
MTRNLSSAERVTSALFGVALSLLAIRRGGPLTRLLTGAVGAGLIARAYAGYCPVKAAALGQSAELAHQSDLIDEAIDESFPASDPPASRLADEPPINAEAKWAAARQAERSAEH